MNISQRIFQVGQFVYAKTKFFPPWPAFILEIRRGSARVQFFAWNNQWYDEILDTYHFHIIFYKISKHLCRAWVGFKKLVPISASRAILDEYYNRNVRFSRAVDELNISFNTVRARRPIHTRPTDTEPILERHRAIESNHQTQSVTQSSHANSSVDITARELVLTGPVVLLKRLTKKEIERALSGGEKSKKNDTNRAEIVPKKYNLRRRHDN